MFFCVSVEKITPKEVKSDKQFISQCQEYLKKNGNTLAMFGEFGSGKRTLAAQIAIRLAKKNSKLKIKIVRDRDAISEDFGSMESKIIIIHNPVKTWFTSKHTDEIINCLSKICLNAKNNNCYIIAIFHSDNWESISQIDVDAMKQMFPRIEDVCYSNQKLTDMALITKMNISKAVNQISKKGIGSPLIISLYLRNSAFQDEHFLNNPTEFIFKILKKLEMSSEKNDQLAFKFMVFFVLHGGEIAKTNLDDIKQHALFADFKEKKNSMGSIDSCIEQLLGLFIEETVDRRSYRVVHDVITRCTFLASWENHRTLLLTECDPILIFDCIQLRSEKLAYEFINESVKITPQNCQEIATLFFQRPEMRSVLQNNILFEKHFQDERKKAKHITNERHGQKKTDKSCILS